MVGELLEDRARDFIAVLGGLIGIGGRAQRDGFAWFDTPEFVAQKLGGVLLDVNLLFELQAVAHLHKLVGVAGIAIAAAELASAVWIDRPGEGHLTLADA